MNRRIPLFSPKFDHKEIDAAKDALKSHFWASGAGVGRVSEFEQRFKKFTGCDECVAVNNGTDALHLALNILDIKKKEVLVPSLTFVTTVHSILYNEGIPVFVDVEPGTLCMDPNDLENKITSHTKAVIPVHFGGLPCNMARITKISKENSIHVAEDAAHACGSKYEGKMIGNISELTSFSFHPVKNLAMPKGGAITISSRNSKNMRKRLNSLRWCGIDKRQNSFYDVTSLGYNHYMDEISAAIGIEQLKKISKLNATRLEIAKRYHSDLNVSEKMPLSKGCSYHLYWIRVKNRKKVMKELRSHGIETGSHYRPVHSMAYYNVKIKLPVTDNIAKEVITLPMHANLKKDDVDFIIKTVNSLV
ncbi:DegT/DnrJ/EryC1/StrS family aminotransferase [Candidatus Nitrosotalea okcheonensis]|uniref:Glutamine--scyllo-inositol transaminase n=1 Tax=Candidatus Nitrosotalea okcheonensis TaxID=1903276 RepID=A0A2H1FHR2_9ARCH|nr:DegT/DnrJ/EryC1/StrS family aminotransferase [Candidatus Nitrosotalea okcheonensis]SMH72309.1 Glutamine--scyllo-inositol transaminase [Candidatus Nitrosotalea okcheonensis]